jgi:hypothetical protein
MTSTKLQNTVDQESITRLSAQEKRETRGGGVLWDAWRIAKDHFDDTVDGIQDGWEAGDREDEH